MASVQVAKPGAVLGWGMLLLRAPSDGPDITLLSARPLSSDPLVVVNDGFAAGWPRDVGQVQWTSYPPTPAEIGATATPLPQVTVDAREEDGSPGTEVFVGLKVPDAGLLMTGIELKYTDGTTTWVQVVPHAVRVCTNGAVDDCPMPKLPES